MIRTPRVIASKSSRLAPAALAAAALAVGLVALPASAQQQQGQDDPSGEAVVRQRTGPEVKVEQGQSPRVLALFTQSSPQQGGQPQSGGNVEIVLIERPTPQAGPDGQPQASAGQPDAKEIVFPAANAREGVVSYGIDGGAARTFTVLARRPGEALQVREVTRSPDVVVMKVVPSQERLQQMQQEMAQKRQESMTQAQAAAEQAGNQAAQQVAAKPAEKPADPSAEQPDGVVTNAERREAAQDQPGQQNQPGQPADAAQAASGQQDGQKPQRTPEQEQAYQAAYQQSLQQAQQQMSSQQQAEPAYAVVMVYLGTGAQ